MALFSIVIPVYNVAPYLRECLDSLLSQTYTSWEAVCVDDGSTDGCAKILDEYAARDARFCVVHQNNSGVSVARNVALDLVRGEYVGFVDGDDAVAPEWLESIAAVLERYGQVDYVFHGATYMCTPGGKLKYPTRSSPDRMTFCSGGQAVKLRTDQLGDFAGTCSGFYRREVIKTVRFNERFGAREDTLFHFSALPFLKTVADSGYRGYVYRCAREGNTISKRTLSQSLRFFEQVDLLLSDSFGRVINSGDGVKRGIARVLTRDYLNCARHSDLHGEAAKRYRKFLRDWLREGLVDKRQMSRFERLCFEIALRTGFWGMTALLLNWFVTLSRVRGKFCRILKKAVGSTCRRSEVC